jgi:uncharacterized protein
MADIVEKLDRLRGALTEMHSVLVAYSGGIDSTLVLKVAHDVLGENAIGVTAVSATLPALELAEARELAESIGARHVTFETDQLEMPEFARNDAQRCFHCKTDLYRGIERLQQDWPDATVVDGTHVDDLSDDRPGLRAAREWGVRSPLLEAGIGKTDIRELARTLGLANADKPAAACLSSRIPRGTPITVEKLSRVERAEAVLLADGFQVVRVRDEGETARIEVGRDEVARLLEPVHHERATSALMALGYRRVIVDPAGYRRGGR